MELALFSELHVSESGLLASLLPKVVPFCVSETLRPDDDEEERQQGAQCFDSIILHASP